MPIVLLVVLSPEFAKEFGGNQGVDSALRVANCNTNRAKRMSMEAMPVLAQHR